MIGDWALLNGKPVQVDKTNFLDSLEPMPLTIPILALNGFAIAYPGNEYLSETRHDDGLAILRFPSFDKDGHRIKATSKDPLFILRLRPSPTGYDIHYSVCCIDTPFKYVHQLQHALRLAGYDTPVIV